LENTAVGILASINCYAEKQNIKYLSLLSSIHSEKCKYE